MSSTVMSAPEERAVKKKRKLRFSALLRGVVLRRSPAVSLQDLLEAFGDRAFGALMFVFAVPNVLPMPPGTSSVLSAPLIIIAAQLAVGRRVLWLPSALTRRSIATRDLERMLDRALPYLRRAERLLAPRLDFMFGPVGDRLIGMVCLLLAAILFLPIPLGNMLPALAVCAFSLALMQRDGIAALFGWAVAIASVAVVALVFGALAVAVEAFLKAFLQNFGV